jgi:hypothetical protein
MASFIKDWDVMASACPLPENDIICFVMGLVAIRKKKGDK